MAGKIQRFTASTTWTIRFLILGVIGLLVTSMLIDGNKAMASSHQTAYDSSSSIAVVGQTGGSSIPQVPTETEQYLTGLQTSHLQTSRGSDNYNPNNPSTREVEVGVTELGLFGENVEFDDERQVIDWPAGYVDPEFMKACTEGEFKEGSNTEHYSGDLDADAEFMTVPPCDSQGRNGVGARDFTGFQYDPPLEGLNIKAPEGHARHPDFGSNEPPTEAELAVMFDTETDIGDDAATDSEERGAETNPFRLSPAEFAQRAVGGSEIEGMTSHWEASQYLAFNRWSGVSEMPSPQVGFDRMTQLLPAISASLSSMVFAIAGLLMYLFGVILIFILSVDFMSGGIYIADYIFADLTTQLLGIQGSPIMLVMAILGIGLVVALFSIAMPLRVRNAMNWGMRSLVIMVLAIAAIIVMSVQSSRNHPDLPGPDSAIAGMVDENENPGSLAAAPDGGIGTPGNWAYGSLGHLVSLFHWMGNATVGLVTDTTSSFANAVDSSFGPSGGSDTCKQYVAGMHAVYRNTPAAKDISGAADLMVSYDQMMTTLYFNNYQLASLGDTRSAKTTWCRLAENQSGSEPGDQLMIARVAGLYRDIAGVGGLGVINGDQIVNVHRPYNLSAAVSVQADGNDGDAEDGSFVSSDGTWSGGADQSIRNASALIGPRFRGTDGGQQSAMYWAVCQWRFDDDGVPAGASINPEWQNVLMANSDDTTFGEASEAGDRPCINDELINNTDKSGFGDGSDAAEAFNFKEDEGWAIVGPMFGWGGSEMEEKFVLGEVEDFAASNEAAYSYYMNTQGQGTTTGLVVSGIAVVLIGMAVKYFGPIAVGSLFAQVVGLLILLSMPFLLILVLIPLQVTRRVFMVLAVKVLAAVMIVTTLIAGLMAVVMAFVKIITGIIGAATGWGGGDTLIMALITGVAAWLSFWAMKHLVGALTGLNMGTVRGGLKVGLAATSPALQELGYSTSGPLNPGFWSGPRSRFRRDPEPETGTPTVRDDVTNPVNKDVRDDNKDLIRTGEPTGERDRQQDPRKAVDQRTEELRKRRQDLKDSKSQIPYGDERLLKNGQERRTNKPNLMNTTSNLLGTASAIPGPQAPWLRGASVVARGLGTATQFGRGALDKYDQGKYALQRGWEHTKQAGLDAAHLGKRGLYGVSDYLEGDLGTNAKWGERHGNRFAATSEQAPGIPSLDSDQLNRNGVPVADKSVLEKDGGLIPGLASSGLMNEESVDPNTARTFFDSVNHEAVDPSLNAGALGLNDHIQQDAAVAWMSGQYSKDDSGLYLPSHMTQTAEPMSNEQLSANLTVFSQLGETGQMPSDIQIPQDIRETVSQRLSDPQFHPRQAEVQNISAQEAQANLAAQQMMTADPARVPAQPIVGNQKLLQEWASIRQEGMATVQGDANPQNMMNWSEPARQKAEAKIREISSYQQMSSQDLDQVLPSENGERAAERSLLNRKSREYASRLLMEAVKRMANRGGTSS